MLTLMLPLMKLFLVVLQLETLRPMAEKDKNWNFSVGANFFIYNPLRPCKTLYFQIITSFPHDTLIYIYL